MKKINVSDWVPYSPVEDCKADILYAISKIDNAYSRSLLSVKFVDTVINSLSRTIQLINNKLTLL